MATPAELDAMAAGASPEAIFGSAETCDFEPTPGGVGLNPPASPPGSVATPAALGVSTLTSDDLVRITDILRGELNACAEALVRSIQFPTGSAEDVSMTAVKTLLETNNKGLVVVLNEVRALGRKVDSLLGIHTPQALVQTRAAGGTAPMTTAPMSAYLRTAATPALTAAGTSSAPVVATPAAPASMGYIGEAAQAKPALAFVDRLKAQAGKAAAPAADQKGK